MEVEIAAYEASAEIERKQQEFELRRNQREKELEPATQKEAMELAEMKRQKELSVKIKNWIRYLRELVCLAQLGRFVFDTGKPVLGSIRKKTSFTSTKRTHLMTSHHSLSSMKHPAPRNERMLL